jgi:excisionase family DNA binding protein
MAKPRKATAQPPPSPRTDLLTYAEAAEQLRVHPKTIRNMTDDGRLDRVVIGHQIQRVTLASVERLIQQGLIAS